MFQHGWINCFLNFLLNVCLAGLCAILAWMFQTFFLLRCPGLRFSFRFDLNLFCYFQFVCANLLYLQLILVSHFLSVDFSGSNQISTQPHHLINVFWKSLYLVLDHLYIYVLSIDILVNPIVHGTYISCNIYCTHLVMCSENEMLVHLDWKTHFVCDTITERGQTD